MNVLIACEESQRVCAAFRKKGHNAFSCDIQPCSGGHPEWHIQDDVLRIINPHQISESFFGIVFRTMNGDAYAIKGKWDLIIAHPPCTYLTVTGNRWFNVERYGEKAIKRHKDREDAIKFFMAFANADCDNIAIENPIGHMSTAWRKPDQVIHPWMFAVNDDDKTMKATCLWLKGLNPLIPTHTEKPEISYFEWYDEKAGRFKRQSLWYYKTRCLPPPERAKAASKTFDGIAQAMAEQWG